MNPCAHIECTEWTSVEFCTKHRSMNLAEVNAITRKPTRAYDAPSELVRGIGVVTTRRILAHRPKHVRRNQAVSYHTGFSPDMLKDLMRNGGSFGRIPTNLDKRTTVAAKSAHDAKLRSIAGTINASEWD